MVRRDFSAFSPVYTIAPATLVAVYLGSMHEASPRLLWLVLILLIAVLSFIATLELLPRRTARRNSMTPVFLAVFGLCAGLAGAVRLKSEDAPLRTLAFNDRVVSMQGTLLEDPLRAGERWYRARLQVASVGDRTGRFFSADGICTALIPARLVRQSLPGGISGRSAKPVVYAKGLGLTVEGSILPPDEEPGTTFLVSDASQGVIRTLGRFRAGLRIALTRVLFDWGEPGGLLLALVSGNRDYVDTGLAEAFKTAGLAHVLALSGMHLSLLALVVIRTGKRIAGSRISLRMSMIAMVFFVWFAGNSPSLDRSLFMALTGILFKRLGFGASVMPVLALSCIAQTVFDPRSALSLAFMLSYGALFGIVLVGEALNRLLECRVPRVIASPVNASIGAQLATAPVSALCIGVLAPAGIPASCVVSPLSSVFLVGGMLLLLVSLIVPGTEYPCGLALRFMYRAVAVPVLFFSKFPPVVLKDLFASALAAILSIATGAAVLVMDRRFRSRRSPHAGFARL